VTKAVDSAEAGCLAPAPAFGLDQEDSEVAGLDEGLLDGTTPVNDDNLDDFLQAYIVCLTAMEGPTVRPRWQAEPANLPTVGTNWAAFGVTAESSDVFAAVQHHSADGAGFDEMQRQQEMEVLVSFYGPNARALAQLFRDQLQIGQNREPLTLQDMGLIETGDVLHVPSLVNEKYLHRADINFRIRRRVVRQYPVLDLLVADIDLKVEEKRDGSVVEELIHVTS
jgi:hypothetical protein